MGPVMPQEPPSSPVPLDSVDASSTPNAPVQPAISAPMPVHLQESNKKSHITVQPIIYAGSSTPVVYQKNIDKGGGQMARFFYDKTGEKTTLADLKAARLQNN